MRRTRRKLEWWLVGVGALLVFLLALYNGRHLMWGKSVLFYMSTGLRMPHDANIIANKENYPLPESNEGETLLVFDIKPSQVANYLARAPWKEDVWHKGPIPDNFVVSGAQIVRPYWTLWDSPWLWYTAYGKDKHYWDGQLLVIDPKTNRVFLLEWNH